MSWSTARVTAVAAWLVMTAAAPVPAQDWIPFQVAGRLAPVGEWQALRLPADATSLLDVTARYREVARTIVTRTGESAIPDSLHTAFVSPPPAAFAIVPLSLLRWPTDVIMWRLSLAIPVALALMFVSVALDDRARARWSWICVAATPLLWYAVHMGQPSAWLFVAAALTVLPSTPGRDVAGGLALGLGVIFKATPVLVVAGLWFSGRRRLAAIAGALSVVACLATLPVAADGWMDFASVSRHLANVVITDWNNASLDAALVRFSAGTTNQFTEPETIVTVTAWLVRLALVGFAVRAALDPRRLRASRVAAVWIGWLAATPLLWLHYLAALVPLAGTTPCRRVDPAVILIAAIGAVVAGRVAGIQAGVVGMAGCAAWLAAAAWLLSNRGWNPEWRRQS